MNFVFPRNYQRKTLMMGKDREPSNTGLHELYRPEGEPAEVDIIAVHGLNGDAFKTWTASNDICWLQHPDFLPNFVKRARILTWGYNATLMGKSTSSERIMHHAQTLVATLSADRMLSRATERPIIFLCHSLGGIVVKRALAYSKSRTNSRDLNYSSIETCTYGILFFGTPHHGASKAKLLHSLMNLTQVMPNKVLQTESNLVKALEEESETLQNINDHFTPLLPNYEVYFFWESGKTDLGVTRDYIVDQDSAAPTMIPNTYRCGIDGDHRSMVKFGKNTLTGFKIVAGTLMMYSEKAPEVIKDRVARSNERLLEARRFEAMELLNGRRA